MSDYDTAEMNELQKSILGKMRMLADVDDGEHWQAMVDHIEKLWENPEAFADGDLDDSAWKDDECVMALHMGVLYGIEYERAYPTGQREGWPVSLDVRRAIKDD